jgi:hypothetical protein
MHRGYSGGCIPDEHTAVHGTLFTMLSVQSFKVQRIPIGDQPDAG